jgi:hypothetical protein
MKIPNIRFSVVLSAVLVLSFSFCFNLLTAQNADSLKKWSFLTDVYIMFPYMDGEIGISSQITATVDASPGDIFSKLRLAGMLYLEAHNNKWAISSDIVYMNLNQEVTPSTLLHSGTAKAEQFVWETAGLFRIFPFLEVGVGGRLNNLQTEIDVRRNVFPAGTEEVKGSYSKTWFDPIMIVRLTADIKDKWLFQLRGDLGGFGVGSDFTWQLQAYAGYRFSKLIQLTAGYRVLSINFDKGVDAERFIYNVDTFGPVLRVGFNY